MNFQKVKNRIFQILRYQEEFLLGKRIIKNSSYSSPDFMIIGAEKAGTTSMFQYLAKHPNIIPSKEKELLYFSTGQAKGLKWYLQSFPLKRNKKNHLTFEGSPSYLYYEQGLRRIKRIFPSIKLVVILRDPVMRTFSQWNFYRDSAFMKKYRPNYKESRLFMDAIQQELEDPQDQHALHRYLNRSQYAKHLKVLYDLFSSNQILVLDFGELKKNPQSVLKTVTDFLKIENIYDAFENSRKREEGLLQTKDLENNQEFKAYNTNTYKEKMDKETESFLRDYFFQFDAEIMRLTGREFSWMK